MKCIAPMSPTCRAATTAKNGTSKYMGTITRRRKKKTASDNDSSRSVTTKRIVVSVSKSAIAIALMKAIPATTQIPAEIKGVPRRPCPPVGEPVAPSEDGGVYGERGSECTSECQSGNVERSPGRRE